MVVRAHMQNGLVVARLEVGTCVYITQGPPLEVQLLDNDRPEQIWCPAEEVKKNARFASMQSKRTAADDLRQRNPDHAELQPMRSR